MNRLTDLDIKFLTGVGPKRAELLNRQLGIRSYYDLLHYFPTRYVDRSHTYKISELRPDMPYVQLQGKFVTFTTHGEGAKRRLQALFSDGTATVDVLWFNRIKTMSESLHTGTEYVIFGKPTAFKGRFSIVHPEIEQPNANADRLGMRGIYPLTETLRNRAFSSRTFQQLIITFSKRYVRFRKHFLHGYSRNTT